MKYGTPLTLNIHPRGRNPSNKEFSIRHLGKGPGEARFGGVYKKPRAIVLPSCFVHCSIVAEASEGKYKGVTVEGPEYETLGMFGSNHLIDDLSAVMQANVLCDKLGMDTLMRKCHRLHDGMFDTRIDFSKPD